MRKPPTKVPSTSADLRLRAEKQVKAKSSAVRIPRNESELQRLVHELEVHQVELELQNTELRQTRDKLETTLERYTDLYEFAPVGYLTLDRAGTILAANLTAATLLVVDRASLAGRRFKTFVGSDAHPAWGALLTTIFTSGTKESAELSARTASGQPLYLQIESLVEASGESCRVAIIDISVRRRLEQNLKTLHVELEEHATTLATANIDLEAFNYTISHDLRKPLSIFYGYCEMLLQLPGNELNEQPREFIQAMYKASKRMKRLITSLLQFSCASRSPLNKCILDLSKMARAVVQGLQHANLEPQIGFRTVEGIMGNGDHDLCRIVLDNLIGNARKHACRKTGTIIEFGAKQEADQLIYFVRDDGPGFDMSMADKLFTPFQRLSRTTDEGYGIGLATVERIVSRHGGRIWVESDPGKGATFFFSLD